MGHADFIVLIK